MSAYWVSFHITFLKLGRVADGLDFLLRLGFGLELGSGLGSGLGLNIILIDPIYNLLLQQFNYCITFLGRYKSFLS